MGGLSQALREERIKKEFVMEMQNKGKLTKYVTEGTERRDAVFGPETTGRVFPGPGGMESVLGNMLRDSEKRIDAVASTAPYGHGPRHDPPIFGIVDAQTARANHRDIQAKLKKIDSQSSKPRSQQRAALLAQEQLLSAALQNERKLRHQAEAEIASIRPGSRHS